MEFNIKQIKAKWKKLSGSELGYKLTNHGTAEEHTFLIVGGSVSMLTTSSKYAISIRVDGSTSDDTITCLTSFATYLMKEGRRELLLRLVEANSIYASSLVRYLSFLMLITTTKAHGLQRLRTTQCNIYQQLCVKQL